MRIRHAAVMAAVLIVSATSTAVLGLEVKRDETIRDAALNQLKQNLGGLRGAVKTGVDNLYFNRSLSGAPSGNPIPNSLPQSPTGLDQNPTGSTTDKPTKLKPIVQAEPEIVEMDHTMTGSIPAHEEVQPQKHQPMDIIFREDNVTWPSMWPYDLSGRIGKAISEGWAWAKPKPRTDEVIIPLSEFRKPNSNDADAKGGITG
ncbi:MAG: hypothetical protein AAF468_13875 [Pseudomonadota bacterium]